MKTFFILLTLFTLSLNTGFAQQYDWIDIGANLPDFPFDTTVINNGQDTIIAILTDLSFINDKEGWITTWHPFDNDSAAILHTSDGGKTFKVQIIENPALSIQMLNDSVGYAGTQNGHICRTTDGGENWVALGSIYANYIADIGFPPASDTGYACGPDGRLARITPSIVELMESGSYEDLESISFPTQDRGYCTGRNVLIHFVDSIWVMDDQLILDYFEVLSGIFMVDTLTGWAVGDPDLYEKGTGGIIIHTTDGYQWSKQNNPDDQDRTLTDVFFLNDQEGWAVGNIGIILHTTDGGNNWQIAGDGLTDHLLNAVQFTSAHNGYIVGNDNTLLKYGELTGVEEEQETPGGFTLYQNYPNPFNPSTKIKYSIPNVVCSEASQDKVILKVYDVLCKEVTTLVNEEKPSGEYEVEFNAEGLPSGVYFYQLRAGKFIKTKKMILLR